MRISDWSSDVCSSDLPVLRRPQPGRLVGGGDQPFAVRRDIAAVGLDAGFARLVRVLFAVPELDGPHIDLAQSGRDRSHGGDRAFGQAFLRDAQSFRDLLRSEEHTSELQSLMRISYAVFCLKQKQQNERSQNIKEDT